MASLLPYEEALALMLDACRPVGTHHVGLADAAGRVLASVPRVRDPLPPFANSAMDGYAVRAAGIPPGGAVLPIAAATAAGDAPPPLPAGHAAPIATGGVLPAGADAIVPIEDAVATDGAVRLPAVRPGAHVRAAGSDLAPGPAPLASGTVLTPADGALLAAIGATRVEVFRRPRIAVLATGHELVAPEATPGPAQIRDANSTALAWACRHVGAEVVPLGIAPDEAGPLRRMIDEALRCDLVVSSAGVSVGARDLVRGVLAEAGVEPYFWGIDLKPGKPLAFGMAGETPVLSLPGNPASALVVWSLFGAPAVRRRAGWAAPAPRFDHATAAGTWPAPEPRRHAVRCALADAGAWTSATPTGDQRSHRIESMVAADALALLDPGRAVRPGEPVRITRI